jgi:hypothetical protein
MLVLDKSGSMSSNTWDHDGDPDTDEVQRWTSLHDVVTGMLGEYGDAINVGAKLFPAIGADHHDHEIACLMNDGVEVGVAANNAEAIIAALPGRTSTQAGATPATEGILAARAHLEGLDLANPAAMVLVTDGAANCADPEEPIAVYDEALPLAVEAAYAAGIPTYVVGIGMSHNGSGVDIDPIDALDEVAQLGGVPNTEGEYAFYDTQDEQQLADALDDIAAKVECTLTLDSAAPGPAYTTVTIDGQVWEHVDDCSQDGWRFTNDSYPYNTIQLCGAACDALQAAGELETQYECPPEG